jgi:hypothetical protein
VEGKPCDDGNPCTLNDKCTDKKCIGEPKSCDDEKECTGDKCDEKDGSCKFHLMEGFCFIDNACFKEGENNPANPCEECMTATSAVSWTADDTNQCSDSDICTKNDRCSAGACKGEPVVCDDQNECTDDSCNEAIPAGVSPYGVMDMAGNVGEWVNDTYDGSYYNYSPVNNPQGPINVTVRFGISCINKNPVKRSFSWNVKAEGRTYI